MDTDRGKVHQEVDSIVGQDADASSDGIDFVVTLYRIEEHYVRAMHSAAAIKLALDRAPDYEEMKVHVADDVEEDEDDSACPDCGTAIGAIHPGWCLRADHSQ